MQSILLLVEVKHYLIRCHQRASYAFFLRMIGRFPTRTGLSPLVRLKIRSFTPVVLTARAVRASFRVAMPISCLARPLRADEPTRRRQSRDRARHRRETERRPQRPETLNLKHSF